MKRYSRAILIISLICALFGISKKNHMQHKTIQKESKETPLTLIHIQDTGHY